MTVSDVVDIDEPASWPDSVTAWAHERAAFLKGSSSTVGDLDIPSADDDPFRALLRGHIVRAYHATRLLDHEVESIKNHGLRKLSASLVGDRIEAAHDNGCISETLRDELHEAHVFATGEQQTRGGGVCLVLSKITLSKSVYEVWKFLTIWGGEAMYMSSGVELIKSHLELLGRPAIVVAHIDLSAPFATHYVGPWLPKLFVGQVLGIEGVGATVVYRSTVPPNRIEGIWQPGNPKYDQFEELPRS